MTRTHTARTSRPTSHHALLPRCHHRFSRRALFEPWPRQAHLSSRRQGGIMSFSQSSSWSSSVRPPTPPPPASALASSRCSFPRHCFSPSACASHALLCVVTTATSHPMPVCSLCTEFDVRVNRGVSVTLTHSALHTQTRTRAYTHTHRRPAAVRRHYLCAHRTRAGEAIAAEQEPHQGPERCT
jgi:hypothetical protein